MTKMEPTSYTVSPARLQSEMFARVFQAYSECNDQVQAAIRAMVRIVNAEDAEADEREAALSTISEALFPSTHDGELGVDLERCDALGNGDSRTVLDELNAEEASFAKRLESLMEMNNMTQADLAKEIGVGQSAISMMLSRNCRPQERTVQKIAEALKVSVEDLWPGIKRQ